VSTTLHPDITYNQLKPEVFFSASQRRLGCVEVHCTIGEALAGHGCCFFSFRGWPNNLRNQGGKCPSLLDLDYLTDSLKLHSCQSLMDWLKGKSTGNHGFSQENNENMGGSDFNFPFNQSIDKDQGMYSRTPFEHWKKTLPLDCDSGWIIDCMANLKYRAPKKGWALKLYSPS